MKNIVIIILTVLVVTLGGYFVYDKVINQDNNKISDNVDEENNGSQNEKIPLLNGLKSITFHYEGDGMTTFEKTISDYEIMKETLLIIKDKEERTSPEGLGGAFNRHLLLKYDDFEIEISMPYTGIISIISADTKYYNVSSDTYEKIYNIFGYQS